MHEVFINYRTEGGKGFASLCERHLSERFGEGSAFLAQKSIGAGNNFVEALVHGVRRSRVLLALVDEHWLDAPGRRSGRRALSDPKDWVRREIEEAFASGVLVVPLLLGRRAEQLDAHRLPKSLAPLAECQYERLSNRSAEADLIRLGDRLVRQVPELAALDRRPAAETKPTPDPGTQPGVRNDHQSGGIGQVGGSVGTFVNESHGPLHSGNGDLVHGGDVVRGPKIVGDGTNHVTGGNRGGIHQRFGPRTGRKDDER
ncbi:TIR domain-containing protein [Streptomyces liangshanensis]|uniref:TIR domain-containing protein n=1 Tax=Streptomyces liangshanensis TaxID=2717324 RepID=UPI0036D902FA